MTLLHTVKFTGSCTTGVGFIVIVKSCVGPLQVSPALAYCGVNVMLAITGLTLAFVVVKEEMFPAPFALNPIEGVLFTHV